MPAQQRTAPRKGTTPYERVHECPRCPAAFQNPSNLKRHVRTVHEKRRDYQCPQCAAAFGAASELRTHGHNVHEKRRDHVCPQCASAFATAQSMNTHVRTVHEKRRDYKCPQCAAAFAHAHVLARHISSKHPNDNASAAECPICLELLCAVADKASTPCAHVFCCACITAALALSGACPACMQPCTAAQLQSAY